MNFILREVRSQAFRDAPGMHAVKKVATHHAVAAAPKDVDTRASRDDEAHSVTVAVEEVATGDFARRTSSCRACAIELGPRNKSRRSSALSQLRYALLTGLQVVVFPTWRGPETKAIWRCRSR